MSKKLSKIIFSSILILIIATLPFLASCGEEAPEKDKIVIGAARPVSGPLAQIGDFAMGPIMEIAARYDLAVIEDACQAHGATYHGEAAGAFGTGTFSFYPTKNITSAEGGMLTTDDPEIDTLCRSKRQHGMVRRVAELRPILTVKG